MSLAFNAEGTKIATGCMDGKLRVIDAESGAVLLEEENGDDLMSVAYNMAGTRIATGSVDGRLRVIDAESDAVPEAGAVIVRGFRHGDLTVADAQSNTLPAEVEHGSAEHSLSEDRLLQLET